MSDGLHVVVRNTFLEFSDDSPSLGDDAPAPRRVRAFSDMTDSKLPVKVELSNNSPGFYQVPRHRVQSSNMEAGAPGGMEPGLETVQEEPGDSGFSHNPMEMYQQQADRGAPRGGPSMIPPGELGWMGPYGMVQSGFGPPIPAGAAIGFGGYGAMPGQGLAAPPFPPGMMQYGYVPGAAPPQNYAAPPHMNQNIADASGGQQPSRAFNKGGREKGQRSHLQLSEHLGDTGGRSPNASPNAKTKGGSAPQPQTAPAAAEVSMLPPNELTTVMLRNVPSNHTRGMLLELLNKRGFEGCYDFVYLPMDFRNGVNLGYAFVNSVTHEDAARLTESLQNYIEWVADGSKVCEVSWAHPHQGLKEHVERYRNSPVMHASMPEEYKPMVFRNGQQIPFPMPTKAIKAPKLRLTGRDARGQGQEEGREEGRCNSSGMENFVAVCA